ncbi:MAG TPA: DNA primase DnaG [Candidatus Nanoarchaeia archaeon]|nr:DNA primase DnaG [Candidatus Nanoarchaeia archaeon]
MAKISPVSSKYIIHSTINIEGVVDKPDVIGAIFGQTEGLLGADLEFRELQRSGRIGRIEVNIETRSGKTNGNIIIPSSLDKAETAIIGAALEIIQRIGPCNSKIKVQKIEDVRISKRQQVVERAKELLKQLQDTVMPDSQELADEVTYSVRIMEAISYGKDNLPAGPAIDESDEVIIVEGRADVLTLLKNGFKNAIAINGTSVPETVKELSKKKTMTAFVDGDRGGDLIIKELLDTCDIDYVTKAPDGKEVEELTKKEIHKALRDRVVPEQVKGEVQNVRREDVRHEERREERRDDRRGPPRPPQSRPQRRFEEPKEQRKQPGQQEKETFKMMCEDLVGTRGAYVLDNQLNILGKVPVAELLGTLRSLPQVYAVVFDGIIEPELVRAAESTHVQYLVGMDTRVNPAHSRVGLVTLAEL